MYGNPAAKAEGAKWTQKREIVPLGLEVLWAYRQTPVLGEEEAG